MKAVVLAVVFVLVLFAATPVSAESDPAALIDSARSAYEKADYPAAIAILRQGIAESPDNADLHYYLGHYLHYLCYDSVPLAGFGRGTSDEVLDHLKRAVELNPHHGDAHYFIGAEYGARSLDAMQHGAYDDAAAQLRQGMAAGGYPPWLVEYGRNMLRSCPTDAILFTEGDAHTFPLLYLQFVEEYRRDINVIPYALMDRPWYLVMIKKGVDGRVPPVPLSWSDEQIQEMHPYKWKSNVIRVAGPDRSQIDRSTLDWTVEPDLQRKDGRDLLSAGRAALDDIVCTNAWRRPLCVALGFPDVGLQSHLQMTGMVLRVLPTPAETEADVEASSVLLLDANNFSGLPSVRETGMPRISGLLANYLAAYLQAAISSMQAGDNDRARSILKAMKSNIPEDLVPVPEEMKGAIQAVEGSLGQTK
jgi:tetratricopeptide (TPR) repeat protein